MYKAALGLAAIAVAALPVDVIANEREYSPEDLMKFATECAYVVSEVGQDAGTRSSGQDWLSVLSSLSQKSGLDPVPYIDEAKAKYRRSSRKMGADWTFKRMKERARDCDQQI